MISIIMPCFNSEEYIGSSISSVINQTYKDWELIVIDDFSEDSSVDIISKYIKCDDRIVLIKNTKNLGAGLSRNRGLDIAKRQFIAFLDSDDIWLNGKL